MIMHTGVIVAVVHQAAILARARGVIDAPAIFVLGEWIHALERESFGEWLDRLAVAYGLPEPVKNAAGETVHYGMSGSGEFTYWLGDADACPAQDVLGQ